MRATEVRWGAAGGFWRAALGVLALTAGACSGHRARPVSAENAESVEAEGWASIDPLDPPGTQRRALADALKKAVEKVSGVYVSAKTRVEAAVSVEQRILANVDGYVRSYELLGEREEGGWHKTRIRAAVLHRKLGGDLRELGLVRPEPPPGNPKVSVSFQALGGAADALVQEASEGVRRGFSDRGFFVTRSIAGDADWTIRGEVSIHPVEDSRLGDFRSFRARLTAHGTQRGTDQVLPQRSQEASAVDPSAEIAAAKAVESAGKALGEALADELGTALKTRMRLLVRLRGAGGLDRVERVAQELRRVPGVAGAALASYEAGVAELWVTTDAVGAQELAEALARKREPALTPKVVTAYELELEGP